MSLYNVFIPTYKRAGNMKTHLLFPNAYIVCPESQLEEYKKYNPSLNYLPCPDSVEGNMAKKRNWILDKGFEMGKYLVMVDDDIINFQIIEKRKAIKMDREQIDKMIINGFQMAEDIGTVFWGINLNTDPMCYREYTPFSLLSVILAPFNAQIKHDLRYDVKLPTKEDYDFSLQILKKYHKTLRFNKYSYNAGHLTNQVGGSISIRSMDIEKRQAERLVKKWGSKIVKFNFDKSINPIVKVPLRGV